jgi:cell division septation protein DedD
VVPVAVKVEKVAQPAKVKEAPKAEVAPKMEETPKAKEAPKAVAKKAETRPHVTEAKKKETVKETPKPEVKKEAAPKPAPATKKYHIIVASLATSADAKNMLQEYKKQGHTNASIIESKNRFRISIGGFADKSAAYAKLNELKQAEAFKNAWMLTAK